MIDDMLELIRLKKDLKIFDSLSVHSIEKILIHKDSPICLAEGVVWLQYQVVKDGMNKGYMQNRTITAYLKNSGEIIQITGGKLVDCLVEVSETLSDDDFRSLLSLICELLQDNQSE